MDISSRILRLLQSVAADQVEQLSEIFESGYSYLDETLKEWEKKHGIDHTAQKKTEETKWSKADNRQQQNRYQQDYSSAGPKKTPTPDQVTEDLQLFGLTPPSSLDEVKKARNREIKKFHPDKFLQEPEKMETAKKILQIYNAAYDRLEKKLK
ncbi:MAG: J domain-containing protein [Proteobacteria bacterium]|nr:J domain-containing protein [Pseudomonadota bacterium]